MGTHLFLTFRLRFIQRYLGTAIRLSFSRDPGGAGDVSHFGALTTALAATIGTGNIVGVATAVALGGPGAVLWMWFTGVFGIATKYGEALLSVKYRVTTSDGTMLGGPMYALEKGLNARWLAVLFCIFTSIAAFGIGNMVQANAIVKTLNQSFGGSTWLASVASSFGGSVTGPALIAWIAGGLMTIVTAVVILGGVRSIARTCEALVPFMAVFYVAGCLIILCFNWQFVCPAVKCIVSAAFTPCAAGGGFVGATVMMAARYGIARGLFSNESGLGSAPIVAAAARTSNPVRQALVSATGTFWDTVVICAMTGLVLVSTMLAYPGMDTMKGDALTYAAFSRIPYVGPIVLTVGMLTFVFSTILGWSYYGERATEYLFGKKSILPYRLAWVVAVFIGSIVSLDFVWDFADAMNALMAIPNVIALLLLSGVIVNETRKYLWENRLDQKSTD
jgi:AGCS family alanine or glycine:cation symporter